MELPIKNDINRITKAIEMFEHIGKISFETETGQEFGNSLKETLETILKPYGRETVIKLRNNLKQV